MEEEFSPRLIELPKSIGKGGTLSYLEEGNLLPFKVKRFFWIYDVDKEVHRGNHCHEYSHRIIVCLNGEIDVEIEDLFGEKYNFNLSSPNQVVYFPPLHWLKMKFSPNAILLSATSHLFEDDVTITNYDDFKALGNI